MKKEDRGLGSRRIMLLSHQRRQHPSLEHHQFNNLSLHDLPLRTSTSTSQFLSPVPAESDIAKLSHSPSSTLESSPAISNFDYSESADYYMPRGYSQNQPARSQPSNSRPTSTQPLSNSLSSFDHGAGAQQASWLSSNNAAHLISQPRFRLNEQHFHKRHSSESTVTSAGPNSPFTPASTVDSPYIVDAESQALYSQHLESYDQSSLPSVTSYPKVIPPTNSNFSDSLLFPPRFPNYSPQYAEDQSLWEQAMRQEMSHQQRQHQQQQPQSSHVNGYRMSQSSQGGLSADLNGQGHGNANTMINNHLRSAAVDRNRLPHLDRTMSDIYQDELYNPAEPTVPAPTSKPSTPTAKFENKVVSPRNSVISERLQAAGQNHIARSSSPTMAVSREKSPFRPNSQFAAEGYPGPTSPVSRLGSASQIREKEKLEAEALAMAQHNQPQAVVNEKTVSPKEVSLEYEPDEEASNVRLMPDLHSPQHAHARTQPPSKLKQELTQPEYDVMSELRRESSSMSSGSSSLRQNGVSRVPQQYPFTSQQRQHAGNPPRSQESMPEFPAHMPSMESTKSERISVRSASSSQSSSSESEIQRPTHTTADTGTYTCTYHGCTQRFETQSKLQKHKRDGHRQGTPSSAGGDSKNTQAGPHKCERINPVTGKPCNSIFSRPYDLTRHEDTIHNARKQKVKCQLCVEDKTFSRNDALTRHMRVVHPEVDFPGKITKRGRV